MKKNSLTLFCLCAFALNFSLKIFAQEAALPTSKNQNSEDEILLQFKFKEGDNFSLTSSVNEEVKINGRLSHKAQIVTRVTESVEKVDENGRGYIKGNFMTSEQSTRAQFLGQNDTYRWGENFESEFWRDSRGKFEIESKYFMPVIRDLPIFPQRPIKVGDEWSEDGYEVQDLRRDLNVTEPFKVPFTAKYKYLRNEKGVTSDSSKTERVFQVISAKYSVYYETPQQNSNSLRGSDYPVTTMGYSNRTIWWDNEKGQIDRYEEDFRIVIETLFGTQYQFAGGTQAEFTEFERTSTEENLKDVMQKVEDLGLKDISVTKTEQGLTISLENIQFRADSAILMESEKEKIKKISQILSAYPNNDLLISGHTARVGSEESCQILSEERAASVANFLVDLKVKEKTHVFTQGFGSKIPIASNLTERGKAKNRRVEITILDK
ncbi:OmpA family protein [Treponema pectinovorum]|uniref:OmpA family protein n=1 Tax=Treponema pectinovorum TaxID=164 RepID=UPI003D8EC00A